MWAWVNDCISPQRCNVCVTSVDFLSDPSFTGLIATGSGQGEAIKYMLIVKVLFLLRAVQRMPLCCTVSHSCVFGCIIWWDS